MALTRKEIIDFILGSPTSVAVVQEIERTLDDPTSLAAQVSRDFSEAAIRLARDDAPQFGGPSTEYRDQIQSIRNMHAEFRRLYAAGSFRDALEQAIIAESTSSTLLGAMHPLRALSLVLEGRALIRLGELDQALECLGESQTISTQLPVQPLTAGIPHILALIARKRGDLAGAARELTVSITTAESFIGSQQPWIAKCHQELAEVCERMGDWDGARQHFELALKCRESLGEVTTRPMVLLLQKLGAVYRKLANYESAEEYCRRALELSKTLVGERDPLTAESLNRLAIVWTEAGKFAQAVQLYELSLDIFRRHFGDNDYRVGTAIANLAGVHYLIGDYETAEREYGDSLKIYTTSFNGQPNRKTVGVLANLASISLKQQNVIRAKDFSFQALDMQKKLSPEGNSESAQILSIVGTVCRREGDLASALDYHESAIQILERTLGTRHPITARALVKMGEVHGILGRSETAISCYQQALSICESSLGREHSTFAEYSEHLAIAYAAIGRTSDASYVFRNAIHADDQLLANVYSFASPRQLAVVVERCRKRRDKFLSVLLESQMSDTDGVSAAYDLVTRRRSFEAEAAEAHHDSMLAKKYPHLQIPLQRRSELRRQLAVKKLRLPTQSGLEEHNNLLDRWESELSDLETTLSQEIPEIRRDILRRTVGHEQIAAALSADALLAEYVRFRYFDFQQSFKTGLEVWKAPKLAAFVLIPGISYPVRLIDLGPASALRRPIQAYQQGRQVEKAQLMLRKKLIEPLQLRHGSHFVVCRDESFRTLDIQSLLTASTMAPQENPNFTYLTTGFDLVAV